MRFGEGGHYDTYPLALSPMFGRMVAEYAFRTWRRLGSPGPFEICELGAGNGQLCLDALLWIHERARHERAWHQFVDRVRYRILERSPALIARQRQHLGPLAETVRWSRGNLAQNPVRGMPFAAQGLIVANEVLDCLPHHKIVPQRSGPAAVLVAAEQNGRTLSRRQLAAALAGESRPRLQWREELVPVDRIAGLTSFLRRYYPERDRSGGAPFFVSPALEVLLANAAGCYRRSDALWIDYGAPRAFHRSAPERRKVFAGPPRSGAGVFDDPGRQDVTFMVDFTTATRAARRGGWRVVLNGPQAELARRSGVQLHREAVELIVRHRALNWMLSLVGAHPERAWRRGAVTWTPAARTGHVPVRDYARRSVREFLSPDSRFRLLITRR